MDKFSAIRNTVRNTASMLMIDRAAPKQSLVDELLSLDPELLDGVSSEKLSQYVLVLGQYLVMLKFSENNKKIDFLLSDKAFEHAYNKMRFTDPEVSGLKTEKAQRAYLLNAHQHLADLEAVVLESEAEKMLLEGMSDAFSELLNALKKEKSGRDNVRQPGTY